MTPELYALVGVCLWFLVLTTVPVVGKTRIAGGAWNRGNRETEPAFPAWIARGDRAQKNLLENLVHFAPVVLVAHVAHKTNAVTAVAALAYLGARVAHGLLYLAGVQGLRSAAFLAGVGAELAIVSQLLR